MAVVRRMARLFTYTSIALFAVACGDASFSPTSPSSTAGPRGSATRGAVITGTVSGAAASVSSSTFSSGFSTAAATKPVTVTVVGTNISTTIDSSGRFHLSGVPAGDVQLRFTGTGLDATLTLRGVQTGDRIDIKVRLTDTSVRIEAERRDRDDDEDDDDDDDGEDEFKGTVSGLSGTCPTISFTLNGTTVRANSSTRYEDGSCARVRNNVRVEVHGQRQSDGSILAARIELED